LNEVGKIFGQFFGLLLSIIGFAAMNTSKGKSQVDMNPIMMALVFMVALYYLVLVLVTMFELQIKSFLDPFMMVILLLGSVISFLALIIIMPMIAWIHLGLWFLFFAFMLYKNRKELYQMIPEMFRNFIESSGSGNIGISTHNLEIPRIESLPV
jgi:phosphoglycerol transferase MdoB-like AlkP superfamily enzyme